MALVPTVTDITSHVAAWTASGIIDALAPVGAKHYMAFQRPHGSILLEDIT